MICKCAARTSPQSARTGRTVLSWQECNACGRCSAWSLTIDGKAMLSGAAAHRAFLDLEDKVRAGKKAASASLWPS